ncbi:MAG TPA: FHA domain-containing protein [Planctomycetaceae bacterium]|nr:FHA domain-containing protein [Planctomycetaceae bacterium]
MQAKLIPVDGGASFTITRDVTVVGRSRELCELAIQQVSVSKLQCLIAKTDGLLFIRDLASTNGTKVNGQRVTRGALLPGDELAFASVKYRVHLGPSVPGEEEEEVVGVDEETVEINTQDRPEEDFEPADSAHSKSDVRLLSDDSAAS